jgi:hypothetical protein
MAKMALGKYLKAEREGMLQVCEGYSDVEDDGRCVSPCSQLDQIKLNLNLNSALQDYAIGVHRAVQAKAKDGPEGSLTAVQKWRNNGGDQEWEQPCAGSTRSSSGILDQTTSTAKTSMAFARHVSQNPSLAHVQGKMLPVVCVGLALQRERKKTLAEKTPGLEDELLREFYVMHGRLQFEASMTCQLTSTRRLWPTADLLEQEFRTSHMNGSA